MKTNKQIIGHLLAIGLLFIMSFGINAKEKNMSLLQNQPVFELELTVSGSAAFIEINGVNVFADLDSDGQTTTTLPVNHWMRSGKNEMKIIILPDEPGTAPNAHADVEIKLMVKDYDVQGKQFVISTLHYQGKLNALGTPTLASRASGKFNSINSFQPDDKGDIEISEIKVSASKGYKGAMHYSRELIIPNSLPEWAFFTSDNLPDTDAMNDEDYYNELDILLVEYMKVQNAIVSRNIDPVLSLFEERSQELDAAFYAKPGTFREKIRRSLMDAATDDNLELLPLGQKMLNFLRLRDKKLTRLVRDDDGPAIALNFKSFHGSTSFNLIFRYDDGKWILTR